MSKDYNICIDAHPNIYNNSSSRKLDIFFSEPENGVNSDTGILNIIAGFGGNANSNVYKKMRSQFADKYNMVVVQCNYFGWEFMQSEILQETLENFNDMGPMQAVDNIFSIIMISEILKDNNLTFNASKIISYGHSHGAYISYLSNRFAPGLFNLIIDNSSWLYPVYMLNDRYLTCGGNQTIFHYLIRSFDNLDLDIYNLNSLYKHFKNKCIIHSFHGAEDTLIRFVDKENFCLPMRKCFLHKIDRSNLNDVFKSPSHSLDADYLKLYDYVMKNLYNTSGKSTNIKISSHRIETQKYSYLFNFKSQIPVLTRELKNR
ncbi:DUF2920 family protein [Acetobacterium fimetarium]|uniref:DUF2920 family protein n=1 Tax=Acetobacterium fimetarium TaxID=52691 RepID=A0ABR6WW58_9FIRM|nr:DUF2920 family protein [Acetobacterium fimetarium]MBC3804831.1 DUF2920 family protein [Acetobacterium fimetarium]